jgi:hypothetical protein
MRGANVMKTLVGFFFPTCEDTCPYFDVWVVVETPEYSLSYSDIREIVTSAPCASDCASDTDEIYVETFMNKTKYKWGFFKGDANINQIVTYFM